MTSESKATRIFRDEARRLLRQWLVQDEADVLAAVDSLGRRAIRDAGQASQRLERNAAHSAASHHVLAELQALADAFATPAAPARRSWFGTPKTPAAPATANVDGLMASLAHERDNITHALIALTSDQGRLAEADAGLEHALGLIRACTLATEAGARELSFAQPARAAFLRDEVAGHILSREQDVVTQLAVTRQGILSLRLLEDGHKMLAQAIDRASAISIAALRTALAARQAISDAQDLTEQARALELTAGAAQEAPASGRDVERVLADAMDQVRRAVDAAEGKRSPDPLG